MLYYFDQGSLIINLFTTSHQRMHVRLDALYVCYFLINKCSVYLKSNKHTQVAMEPLLWWAIVVGGHIIVNFKSVLFAIYGARLSNCLGKEVVQVVNGVRRIGATQKGRTSLSSQLAFIHTAFYRLRLIILDGDFCLSQSSLVSFYTPVH